MCCAWCCHALPSSSFLPPAHGAAMLPQSGNVFHPAALFATRATVDAAKRSLGSQRAAMASADPAHCSGNNAASGSSSGGGSSSVPGRCAAATGGFAQAQRLHALPRAIKAPWMPSQVGGLLCGLMLACVGTCWLAFAHECPATVAPVASTKVHAPVLLWHPQRCMHCRSCGIHKGACTW